jgi:uncharacterized protein YciI
MSSAMAEKLHFMYVMYPTDPKKAVNRDTWTEYDFETFDLHMAHLNQARDAGKLVLAGRTLESDGSGPAIAILEVDSEDEAQRIFESEPFFTRGFATGKLHPFSVAISRKEV